ncbi:MAG: aminotransferase class V-fold PLP-dependent enzyme, partial [Pseudomonadota bacterium]
MMYLNTCSHGLPRARTLHRMAAHLAREAELGEARAAADVAPELAQAQKDAAEVMAGADADVGFAFTTTQIWTHVLTCLARPGARVLLCDWEWGAHLRFAEDLARRTGVVLDILPAQDALDPEAWAERIDGDLALIAAPLVTSVTGQMLPAAQIAALPRPEHTLTLL